MSLDVVKKFVEESGNTEVLEALNAFASSNLDRVNYLEKELQSSISKRDKSKSVIDLVKSKLGVDEISDETIDKILSSKSKANPEFEAEKRKLEDMVAMLQTEKESISSKFEATVNMHRIERGLTDLGAPKEVNGSKAYDILMQEVTAGATFVDGELVFKANDGTTIRNADGTPMSLADRYNQIKDSDELRFLFNESKQKSGSGVKTTQGGGGKQITSLEGLNDTQRLALFRNDPELFKKLSKG